MSHFRTTFRHSTTTISHHHQFNTSVLSVAENRRSFPCRPYSVPNEVFVGNLSFFCEEVHLYELFSQYSNVTNVRIVRTEDRSRSLLFGFVALKNPCEMDLVSEIFNNHLHMGRQMRVEPSSKRTSFRNEMAHGHQIHIAISSSFMASQIVRPTETLLRKFFLRYGSIIDLQVNVYFTNQTPNNKQEGYAFLTFAEETSANAAITTFTHHVEGLTLICTKPQRDASQIIPKRAIISKSRTKKSNKSTIASPRCKNTPIASCAAPEPSGWSPFNAESSLCLQSILDNLRELEHQKRLDETTKVVMRTHKQIDSDEDSPPTSTEDDSISLESWDPTW